MATSYRNSGFTLVEILVVIIIISVIAGITVISLGNTSARQLANESRKMQRMLALAADEAVLTAREIGIVFSEDGKSYTFHVFDDSKLAWIPYEQEPFTEQSTGSDYVMELQVEGEQVDLKELYGKKDDEPREFGEKEVLPALIFFSDGQYVPFKLDISMENSRDNRFSIHGDGLSPPELEQSSED